MTAQSIRIQALGAAALIAGIAIAQPAQAQIAGETDPLGEQAPDTYDEEIADVATRENWAHFQRLAYKQRMAESGPEVPASTHLREIPQRDFRARALAGDGPEVFPGGRPAAPPSDAVSVAKGNAAREGLSVAQRSPAYRDHAARIGTDQNWSAVEDRGLRAQRTRPGFEIRSLDDLSPRERFELDRQGRAAQRVRGARLPTSPIVPKTTQKARTAFTTIQPTSRPGKVRGKSNFHSRALYDAGNLDFASEAFGGEELGLTRFASDVTIGQVANALNGGDPMVSLYRSTGRLGDNIVGGLTGIGESIIDPRRIPGNALRATEGAITGTIDTARWAAETTGKTIETAVRVITQPGQAKKEGKKAIKTGQNIAKTICTGLSWLIPSNTSTKRRGC